MSQISRKQLFLRICQLPWFEYTPLYLNGVKCIGLSEKDENGYWTPALIMCDKDFENNGLLSNHQLIHPAPDIKCLRGFIDRFTAENGCVRVMNATVFDEPTEMIVHVYMTKENKLSMVPLFFTVTEDVACLIDWGEILTI